MRTPLLFARHRSRKLARIRGGGNPYAKIAVPRGAASGALAGH